MLFDPPSFTIMADTKSLTSLYDSDDKGAFRDEIVAAPHAENVGGAPLEANSPLGRHVGSFSVVAINVSMMIGTGICACPSPSSFDHGSTLISACLKL